MNLKFTILLGSIILYFGAVLGFHSVGPQIGYFYVLPALAMVYWLGGWTGVVSLVFVPLHALVLTLLGSSMVSQWLQPREWLTYLGFGLLLTLVGILRQTSQKLREAMAELKAQRNRGRMLAEVFEVSDESIEWVDAHHRFVDVNPAFERLTGYSKEDVLGKTPKEVLRSTLHKPEFYESINETIKSGKPWRGELFSQTKRGDDVRFDMTVTPICDQDGEVTHFLAVRRDLTQQLELRKQLERDALYDTLTGLPNRKLFVERLEKAIFAYKRDPSKSFAVMFLDLDRFKRVNDSLGHLAGDKLLIEAAQRLKGCLRNTDTVARFGGDEFAILLELSEAPRKPVMVAQRIQQELCRPFRLNGNDMLVSTSIGITMSSPEYDHPEEFLRDADTAMYRAKDTGRARHAIFDQEMHEEVNRLLKLEDELRQAVEKSEFVVHFQPVIDLKTSGPLGVEALIRWNHPSGELKRPGEFLAVVEDMGLIQRLDSLSFELACSHFLAWKKKVKLPPTFRMHFNLSPHQFAEPDLADKFGATLRSYGLEPSFLKLEVSEAAIAQDVDLAKQCINGLHEAGFRIVMDNFGAGSSSMIHLQRLKFDELKLDRSFVHELVDDPTKPAIVRAIIQLSHMLNMNVIAEGVEKPEQENHLLALGCSFAQGYLYARPMDEKDMLGYLQERFG